MNIWWALLFLYVVGAVSWLVFWWREAELCHKNHPGTSGGLGCLFVSFLAPVWPIALMWLWLS
jgi:hypothetical protein